MAQYRSMDEYPLTFFHVRLMILVFGAHMIDGYALGIIGYVIAYLNDQQPLSPLVQGVLGCSALPGLFLGSLLLGRIADRKGRNIIFLTSFVIIFLASFFHYFWYSIPAIIFLRFILGIGIGGDYAVGLTLLAEFLPKRSRGVLLSLFSLIWTVGYVAAIIAGKYFLAAAGPDNVRWLLAFPALPALFIMLLRLGIPESPAWLLSRGRAREARAVIQRYFPAMADTATSEGSVCAADIPAGLFSPEVWRKTVFTSLFFICIVIPYFAIYTYFPILMEHLSLPQIFGFLSLDIFLLFGAIAGLWFVWKLPRRVFTLCSFFVLFVCLVVLSQMPSPGIMLIAFAFFTLVMSAVSNLTGVYLPECFPTHVRSTGVGFATAMSRIGAALGTFLLPLIIEGYGLKTALLLLSGVLLLGLVVSWRWAPETRNASLND